jgi:hypothetical protein
MNETDNAYYTDKTPPLIKMDVFTSLSEQEVSKMRSFLSITDSRIQDGEVFFYCPNTGGARDIEGDFREYDNNKPVSAGAALPAGAQARRQKVETLLADGSSRSDFVVGHKVMWLNPIPSPSQFVLVQVALP